MTEEQPANPTMEIISDTEADIVKGGTRFKITGGNAAEIIWAYRHCLSHPETGEKDAAHFLWGLHSGLYHWFLVEARLHFDRAINRRLDDPR